MSKDEAGEFISGAIRHAKERWCLDDEEIVREWCERRADADTPELLVDAFAVKYGLVDSQDEVGTVRTARRLLGEYEDLFGGLREVVLAKLSR